MLHFLLFPVWVYPNPATGQESIFDANYFRAGIGFDNDCSAILTTSRTGGLIIDHRFFLLEHDSILNEIEANEEQKRQLKKLVSWQSEKSKSILATWDRGERPTALSELKDTKAEANRKLDEILLDYQLDLIQNIGQRLALRRDGVLKFLVEGDFAKELKLEPHQIKRLAKSIQTLQDSWNKLRKQKSGKLVDELLEILNEEQTRKIKTEFGSRINDAPFEVHLVQLAMISNGIPRPTSKKSTRYLAAMAEMSQYDLGHDGAWVQQKPWQRLSEGSAAYFLITYMRPGRWASKPILTDKQMMEADQLLSSIRDDARSLRVVRQKELKAGLDPETVRKNEREANLKIYGRAVEWLKENLTEDQAKEIVRQLRIRSMRCNGLLYELVAGKVGKELQLDKQQRKALDEFAKDKYEELFNELERFETRIFSEVHKSLSRNQSQQLKRITRARPKTLCPSITLLLLDNRPVEPDDHIRKRHRLGQPNESKADKIKR